MATAISSLIGYEPGGEGSYPLTKLAKGRSQFASVTLDKPVKLADGVQWDGKYLVAGDGTNNVNNGAPAKICYQRRSRHFRKGSEAGRSSVQFLYPRLDGLGAF